MSSTENLATSVFNRMYNQDGFSQWLGIELLLQEEGHCILKMNVRKEMLNGYQVAHGGIVFSLADSAFAFACNSYNRISVSIECSVTHANPVYENDVLKAEASLITQSDKIGTYQVIIKNQQDIIVGVFKGICYRTTKAVVEA
ncbi:MAG: hotdog fold thioesterase [Bacteroidota bacterium]|nr:hotdog fold thioesterase [Bacteroidota bacterium]